MPPQSHENSVKKPDTRQFAAIIFRFLLIFRALQMV
jgi:hypothetical protein